MNKLVKTFLYIIGGIVVVILILGTIIKLNGIPSYEVNPPEITVIPSPEKLERGKKLVTMLCAGCHMNAEKGNLTGQLMPDAPPEFGTIYSANITNDTKYGIGNWTDGEIAFLLRTGIKRDGKYAPPYMAKLPKMADADIEAIIAFLRSDDALVAPDPVMDKACEPSFLTIALTNLVFKPFPMPTEPIPLPDTTNMVELGMYLAHNLECFSCHSADFKTNDYLVPENSPGYYAGGNSPLDLNGQVIKTPNLTPDRETGIGSWTEEQFVKALRFGIKEGESALRYPMRPYPQLTEKEASAIFQYLKTIPPISNKVERFAAE